jgi:hypothetical protein
MRGYWNLFFRDLFFQRNYLFIAGLLTVSKFQHTLTLILVHAFTVTLVHAFTVTLVLTLTYPLAHTFTVTLALTLKFV